MKNCTLLTFLFWTACATAQQKLVAVQQYRDSVIIFDAKTGVQTGHIKIGFKPHEVTYDAVTKKCFVSNFGLEDYDLKVGKTGNSISVIDPFIGRLVNTIYTSADTAVHSGPHGIKIRPGKWRELFVNLEIGGDTMLVFDPDNLQLKRKFRLPPGTHNFAFSADGRQLWLMEGANGVSHVDPLNGAVIQHETLSSPIRGLLVAKNWLVASGKNEVFLLSKTDLKVKRHFSDLGVGQMLYANITPDQKHILAPAAFENVVLVIDARTGKVIKRVNTGSTPINVQVSGNRAFVTHARDSYIAILNLKTFTLMGKLPAFGTNGLVMVE